MSPQAKKQTNNRVKNSKLKRSIKWNIIAIASIVIGLGAVSYASEAIYYFVKNSNDTANRLATTDFRDLILNTTDMHDTPLDPKTGDAYFPQLKVYVPASSISNVWLQSSVLTDNRENPYISVSNMHIIKQVTSKIYSSSTLSEMFTHIPKYNACSRGISLTYNQSSVDTSDNNLITTLQLTNGKKLYEYLDKGCLELSDTAKALKDIQSY